MKTKFEKMSKKDRNIIIAKFCNQSQWIGVPNYDNDWNALMDVIHRIEIITKKKFKLSHSKGTGYNITHTYRDVFVKVLELDNKMVTI